ncbi:sensor histidine kinase [uncultured Methanobacterium sp.]|uniref:sensor histidine kinase n=1 Tax=uncultured Methanobacterium sp. TaxID=176306 RepID=UPI002AA85026|nr:sensor histidine kinase [uncultured Methanobacterium sp.]
METRETVLISMVNRKNSEMVGELLGTDYQIVYDLSEIPDRENGLSLLIMDLPSWAVQKEEMKQRREKEKPLFLPYLLVTSSSDLLKVQGDVWESFDEVITVPITKIVLQSRVKVLLQTRRLSLQVNQLLKDKEMLMKEIHHRVKNNLMIISSLLNLQSRYIKDDATREIFKESQTRAQSMALIHERLYRSGDLKSIAFSEYIRSLTRDIFNTYNTSRGRIQLQMDVQNIMVDVNSAVPLGLIINELVTNSLKYAFPNDQEGIIRIQFHKEGDCYLLEVGDNGVGIPDDFDILKSDSLGMLLVNSLTSQIQGELELKREKGTTFIIRFREDLFQG